MLREHEPIRIFEQLLRAPFIHLIRTFEPTHLTSFALFDKRLSDPMNRRSYFRQLQLLERTLEMFCAIYGDEDLMRRVYAELHLSPQAKLGRPIAEVWALLQHLCSESTGSASEYYREHFGTSIIDYTAHYPAAVRSDAERDADTEFSSPQSPRKHDH